MDPSLIDPTATQAVPAPFWFIQLFKVLGFTLHSVPMSLWYAGIPVAMLLRLSSGARARQFSGRLMSQMPVLIAIGVNLGIVPLLFVQLAYPQFFYSATILMAWYWFGIIFLLIPAYYGVYLYAYGLPNDGAGMSPLRQAAGWGAAIFFITIGFVFANAFSLMTHVDGWRDLWETRNVGGASLGTALNTADATLWPRWILMFSLALMTTAVWSVVDAAWFATRTDDDYKTWVSGFAWKLYLGAFVGFAAAGSWYAFGSWSSDVREVMFRSPFVILTVITAILPALPAILLVVRRHKAATTLPSTALLVALGQVAVLAANAISRQVVQTTEVRGYMQGWGEAIQWSPLITFLIVFVIGCATIAWMILQITKAAVQPMP